jgi:hypothetical protein
MSREFQEPSDNSPNSVLERVRLEVCDFLEQLIRTGKPVGTAQINGRYRPELVDGWALGVEGETEIQSDALGRTFVCTAIKACRVNGPGMEPYNGPDGGTFTFGPLRFRLHDSCVDSGDPPILGISLERSAPNAAGQLYAAVVWLGAMDPVLAAVRELIEADLRAAAEA